MLLFIYVVCSLFRSCFLRVMCVCVSSLFMLCVYLFRSFVVSYFIVYLCVYVVASLFVSLFLSYYYCSSLICFVISLCIPLFALQLFIYIVIDFVVRSLFLPCVRFVRSFISFVYFVRPSFVLF